MISSRSGRASATQPSVGVNSGDATWRKIALPAPDTTAVLPVLYFGSFDGLGISLDDGLTWSIPRARPVAGQGGQPDSYVYPNPFSPSVDPNVTRFEFDRTGLSASDRVTIRIYDFAMDQVATVVRDGPAGVIYSWDGRNNNGRRVANGTYIYTILAGSRKFWGKVTVRN